MRKHFLLLFLLTLLPFSAWAVDVIVYPQDTEKAYGATDPVVTASMFATDVAVNAAEKAAIAAKLSIVRVQKGEDANGVGYAYRFSTAGNVEADQTNDIRAITIMPSGTATLYINELDFANADLALNLVTPQYLDGTQKKPGLDDFTVTFTAGVTSLSRTLVAGTDYTIVANGYGNNNSVAGGGTVTIAAASSNFTGTKVLNFAISGVDIASIGTISYTGDDLVYDGDAKEPAITDFTFNLTAGGTLAATNNWQIKQNAYGANATYADNTHAGNGKVTIQGINDYSGEVEVEFPIAKYAVAANGLTVTKTDPTYNGKAQGPNITKVHVTAVDANNQAFDLTEDDYEVEVGNNINQGNYTATIKFKDGGNFAGTNQAVPYTISKMSLATVVKNVVTDGLTYTGSAITPEYSLKVSNDEDAYVLQLGKDFTVVEANNTVAYVANADKATIKFKATTNGNFEGETAVTEYEIGAATLTVTPNNINASFGSSILPIVTVTGWQTAADEEAGYTGDVVYTYTGIGNTQYNASTVKPTENGTYSISISVANLAATNYKFAVAQDANQQPILGTLTISAGELLLAVNDRTITYGSTPDPYTVRYKSGLSDADALNFNTAYVKNVEYQIWNEAGTEQINLTQHPVNTLDKGKYMIKAAVEQGHTNFDYTDGNTIAAGTYNVIIGTGTLTINQRKLDDVTVTINSGNNLTYTGVAQTPAYTVTLNQVAVANDENANFTIAWANNTNASIDAETYANNLNNFSGNNAQKQAAQKAYKTANLPSLTLTAAANGNFYGSKEVFFTIEKVDLEITANEGTWKYGNLESEAAATWTYVIKTADLVDADKSTNFDSEQSKTAHKFSGTLKVKRTDKTGISVGEYYDDTQNNQIGLIPYGLTSTNYNIVAHVGKLTITKGDLVLKVKDYNEKYGDNYSTNNFELEYFDGLTDPAKQEGWAAVVDQTGVVYTAVEADGETEIAANDIPTAVDGTVKLKAEGATSTNYNITYELGTYTVVKRPIALTLANQNITYGDDIVKVAVATQQQEATISLTANINGNNFINPETLTSLLADGSIEMYVADGAELNPTGVAQADAIRATINHANYVLDEKNSVWGALTVAEVNPLVIDTEDEDLLAKIQELDGASNITVQFANRTLKANTWYTMVLPFEVKTAELVASLKAGTGNDQHSVYAIVNRMNESTTASKINFTLEMLSIPANEPFLIKTAEAVDMADVTFTKRIIAYDADPVIAYGGNELIGTYTAVTNLSETYNTTDKHWGFLANSDYVGSKGTALDNDWYNAKLATFIVNPTEAYLHYAYNPTGAAPVITIEDYDFGTGATAIKTLNADTMKAYAADGWYTLDGIKLQNVPTEKGVYIQNGKKVVVK